MGDVDYFKKIRADLESGGYENLLHYLLNLDLSGFKVGDVPKTDALNEQKDLSRSPEEQWWMLTLRDGLLPGAWLKHPRCAYSGALFASMRHRSPALDKTGDAVLAGFIQKKGATEKRTNWARGWKFPPLSECRAAYPRVTDWAPQDDWAEPAPDRGATSGEPVTEKGAQDDIPF
jgi:hypothetical protein